MSVFPTRPERRVTCARQHNGESKESRLANNPVLAANRGHAKPVSNQQF
jgi:hypothetical protein